MPKTRISEYSSNPALNTDIDGINIAEGMAPSDVNNAIRELMSQLKDFQTGASADAFTFAGGVLISGSPNTVSGSLVVSGNINSSGTTNTFSGGNILSGTNTISGSAIISGNINSSGSNTFSGAQVISGNINSSGTNTFSGATVISNTLSGVTQLNVDNLRLDGNTISSTDTNGNIVLAPNGTGDVQVDADTLRVGDSGANATISSNGNADLILQTGNATTGSITLEDGANGNISITPNGTGEVALSKVNIDAGAIDGTTIGANSAAAGTFTTATVGAGTVSAPAITTTGDVNTGIFFPAADTIAFAEGGAEAMRIDSNGNVGIGTTSPTAISTNYGTIDIRGLSGGGIRVGTSSTSSGLVYGNSGGLNLQADGTTLPILFYTNSTERMRIDSSGNVGIGTSSPSGRLHVETSGSAANLYIRSDISTTALASRILFGNSVGNARVSFGLLGGGGEVAYLGPEGSFPLYFQTNGTERARITSGGYFKASNSGSYVSSTGTYHEFNQDASAEGLLIYVTNASYASSAAAIWATRDTTNNSFYAFSYYNAGASAYKFRVADSGNVTNTNNSYGQISDIKTKQDIVDAASQWDDIKNIRVRKFRFKNDPTGPLQIGVVAQEAEEVSPGLIEEHPDYEETTKTREVEKTREVTPAVFDDEGNEIEPAVTETYTETEEYIERVALETTTKSVKYSVLYMKAVKALQEAMTRIETLEAEVAALKAK